MASGSDNLLTIHSNNTTERVRVDSSGNLTATSFSGDGSSLTGVASTENIRTNTNATFLQNVNVSGTSTIGGDVNIADKIVHTGDTNTAIRFPSADVISFENGGTETARASATNQFSVGTTADIAGVSVSIGGSVRLVNANDRTATITAMPSGTYNTGVSGGSAIAFHRVSDGGGGSDEIAFETHHQGSSHAESLRIEKAGDIKVNRGDLYFGTAGKGIVLGATSNTDANTLDDYEEGTWTPNIRNDGATATWTTQQGRYVKIGEQVTVWFNADGGSTPRSGGGSGALIMTGLPFTQVMFGNPILGIIGANDHANSGLYSTAGLILNIFGQGGTQVRFGVGGQSANFGINYVAGCFTYTHS